MKTQRSSILAIALLIVVAMGSWIVSSVGVSKATEQEIKLDPVKVQSEFNRHISIMNMLGERLDQSKEELKNELDQRDIAIAHLLERLIALEKKKDHK